MKSFDSCIFTSIHFPASLKTISNKALYYLPKLVELTYCGNYIFTGSVVYYCDNLQYITVHSAYKSETFGDYPINKSESLICPSVIKENSFSVIYSLKHKDCKDFLSLCLIWLLPNPI